MERKRRPVSPLQEIQSEIKEEKAKLKRERQRKWMRIFFIIITGVSLAFIVFLYDQSDYSKVNYVEIIGNHYLVEEEVIQELQIKTPVKLYSFLASDVEKKVPEKSLIEKVKVTKHWFNQSMTVEVTEKKLVGYRWNQDNDLIELIAHDGSTKGLRQGQFSFLEDLPRFTGFDTQEQLDSLVDGLSRVEPILYSNVSEIIRNPKTYDDLYLRVLMADGVQLYTSIYSFESLSAEMFTEIFNRLNENQKCIVYDVFWRSTYAKPCDGQ